MRYTKKFLLTLKKKILDNNKFDSGNNDLEKSHIEFDYRILTFLIPSLSNKDVDEIMEGFYYS